MQIVGSRALSGREVAVTLGMFDGLHRGHQAILERLKRCAGELPKVLVTFEPHPKRVIFPERPLPLLTTAFEKKTLAEGLGIDAVWVVRFSPSVRHMKAADFAAAFFGRARIRWVIVGYDFRFGYDRKGDSELLCRLSSRYGFRLFVHPPVTYRRVKISSSKIREKLCAGDVRKAAAYLKRPYHLSGLVVKGSGRGQSIGVPTANLSPPPEKLVPAQGVYAVRVAPGQTPLLPKKTWKGVLNIGTRPTFEAGAGQTVEVHLLARNVPNLYGEKLTVFFVQRLRAERKFANAQALKAQIERDIAKARQVLTE